MRCETQKSYTQGPGSLLQVGLCRGGGAVIQTQVPGLKKVLWDRAQSSVLVTQLKSGYAGNCPGSRVRKPAELGVEPRSSLTSLDQGVQVGVSGSGRA